MLKKLLLLALFLPAPAWAAQDPLIGLWQTQDKDAVVQFYECGEGDFCGRFYWLQDDSEANPSRDDKNKDPDLRKRRLCGLTFLGDFRKSSEGLYEGGWLYSARHGASFSAKLTLKDKDTLALRGFVFLPFLGGSQEWHRLSSSPACPGLPAQ